MSDTLETDCAYCGNWEECELTMTDEGEQYLCSACRAEEEGDQ